MPTKNLLHCQVETAEAFIDKEANYILIVKGNQPSLQDELHDAVVKVMENDDPKVCRTRRQEINRGRIETCDVIVQPVPKDSAAFAKWAGIKSIGVIHRTRDVDGKLEEATETFISSREPKVRDIAHRIREHWGIENQQHYILDVTFSEDASRIRNGNSPKFLLYFAVWRSMFCNETLPSKTRSTANVSGAIGITQRSKSLSPIFQAINMQLPWLSVEEIAAHHFPSS